MEICSTQREAQRVWCANRCRCFKVLSWGFHSGFLARVEPFPTCLSKSCPGFNFYNGISGRCKPEQRNHWINCSSLQESCCNIIIMLEWIEIAIKCNNLLHSRAIDGSSSTQFRSWYNTAPRFYSRITFATWIPRGVPSIAAPWNYNHSCIYQSYSGTLRCMMAYTFLHQRALKKWQLDQCRDIGSY